MTPITNAWAVVGSFVVAVVVVLLQALDSFFATGQPWPETPSGWLRVLLPAIVAGLLTSVFPHYSTHERTTGSRISEVGRDAPVVRVGPRGERPPG